MSAESIDSSDGMRGSYGQMEAHPSDGGLITKRMALQDRGGDFIPANLNECVLARRLMRRSPPNVIGYRAVRASHATGALLIDQERGPRGNLHSFIHDTPSSARIRILRPLLTGLAEGLAALHGLGVMHGDLKAANVVLTAEHGFRIIDFGSCQFFRRCPPGTHNSACTYTSAPPEMFGVGPLPSADTLPKTDAYSLGTLMFECIFKRFYVDQAVRMRPEFEQLQQFEQFRDMHLRGMRLPTCPPRVPSDLHALMCRLLDPNPHTRLGVSELYELLTAGMPVVPAFLAKAAAKQQRTALRADAEVQLVRLCPHEHTLTLARHTASRFVALARRDATDGEIAACAAIATSLYQFYDVDNVRAAPGDVFAVLRTLDFEVPVPL
jgi:serine/threonine protein kinase